MVEVLTTIVYAIGGVALGLFVEMPFYNKVSETRRKYRNVMEKIAH